MTPERAKAEEILSDWFGIWFRRLGGEAAVDKNQHDDLRQRIASALLAARREEREALEQVVRDKFDNWLKAISKGHHATDADVKFYEEVIAAALRGIKP